MAFPQRLNVLLSRARDGLIIIGNVGTFSKSRKGKEIWTKLFGMLKHDGHIYEGLPVKCERHPERTALLRDFADFEKECPDGGCNEPWLVMFMNHSFRLTSMIATHCSIAVFTFARRSATSCTIIRKSLVNLYCVASVPKVT